MTAHYRYGSLPGIASGRAFGHKASGKKNTSAISHGAFMKHAFIRLMDIVLAMVLLVYLSPAMIAITLLLSLTDKGPIFYLCISPLA